VPLALEKMTAITMAKVNIATVTILYTQTTTTYTADSSGWDRKSAYFMNK
jgi:hypothetical protein